MLAVCRYIYLNRTQLGPDIHSVGHKYGGSLERVETTEDLCLMRGHVYKNDKKQLFSRYAYELVGALPGLTMLRIEATGLCGQEGWATSP